MVLENASSCFNRLRLHPLKETLQNLIVAVKGFSIKRRHFCHVFLPLHQLFLKLKLTANGSEKKIEAKPSLSKTAMVSDIDLLSPICPQTMATRLATSPFQYVSRAWMLLGWRSRQTWKAVGPANALRCNRCLKTCEPPSIETGDEHFRDWDPYHSIPFMPHHRGSPLINWLLQIQLKGPQTCQLMSCHLGSLWYIGHPYPHYYQRTERTHLAVSIQSSHIVTLLCPRRIQVRNNGNISHIPCMGTNDTIRLVELQVIFASGWSFQVDYASLGFLQNCYLTWRGPKMMWW